MAINSLKDVYIDQLQDIYSALKQSRAATEKLVEVAAHDELREALKDGVKGIEQGMDSASSIVRAHGEDPTDEFCKGMEGLVKEVHAHVLDAEFGDDDARDAMLITQYQRMAHYAIAGWGCVAAFAKRLDLEDDASKIQTELKHTIEGDERMTKIAISGINSAAA
ncbi:ycfI, structural protein [Roseivivax marinus]|uniref:YcfI, structural protein n=1 Tax=Roseivivax marinus TaxID=1379903 RepID=W4HDH6_9RHOB|nr:DUF892 family protein [Roseivivax marinus]ETW10784.1 ycfI, structural protein [Roseivivax marinus]